MDIFNILSYINKVSLIAFFITTLVVGYQIYILKKEKSKEQTPAIPDFKEKSNFNEVVNFTSLPSSFAKKELKTVNYTKLVFLIISLLTIMVVLFVFILIKQNSSLRNQALVNPPTVISQTPTRKSISPTPKVILSPTLIATLSPELASSSTISLSPSPTTPTITPTVRPTVMLSQTTLTSTMSPTIVPTEIILAQAPSSITTLNPANGQEITDGAPKILPETSNWEKGFLIIGVAISTIFFSFWF